MSHFCRQLAVWLWLGVYLLAVTVGGAFHTHTADSCCAPVEHETDCCHDLACHTGHSHDAAPDHEHHKTADGSQVAASDADCAVCSFLAQKPVPTAPVECVESTDLEQPVTKLHALAAIDHAATTIFIRGPPVA
jgi:hypothetical protein